MHCSCFCTTFSGVGRGNVNFLELFKKHEHSVSRPQDVPPPSPGNAVDPRYKDACYIQKPEKMWTVNLLTKAAEDTMTHAERDENDDAASSASQDRAWKTQRETLCGVPLRV